jgi:DNA recombination protein RmuC
METIIVLLLVALIGIILFALFKMPSTMHKTIESARREVEMSKNVISDHAVKTLDTIKTMGATLEKMMQHQKESHELGNSLKYLLQTPKLRGSYGEEVLEEMLDKALPKGVWEKQYSVDGAERVDAVVKYKDVTIPIDAKFPREIYEKYLNAGEGEEKKRSWKLYEEGMKLQINSIKSKYIKPHKGTSDFALMFIPSESIYYETIAEKNHLGEPCHIYEYARNNKVMPVSPNTFYAFLQIVIMGIRNLDIIKSAKKLQEALIKIERNFMRFYAKYEEIGSSLDKAQSAFKVGDTHIKRFKDNIDSTLKLDLPNTPQNK